MESSLISEPPTDRLANVIRLLSSWRMSQAQRALNVASASLSGNTTGKVSGEGSFSRIDFDSRAEGAVCSDTGKEGPIKQNS
jgi:hypothetical protein